MKVGTRSKIGMLVASLKKADAAEMYKSGLTHDQVQDALVAKYGSGMTPRRRIEAKRASGTGRVNARIQALQAEVADLKRQLEGAGEGAAYRRMIDAEALLLSVPNLQGVSWPEMERWRALRDQFLGVGTQVGA